ncbi:MAG: tetratricopeptide repeat protein, partial [Flavobacteriaceae bacterium]
MRSIISSLILMLFTGLTGFSQVSKKAADASRGSGQESFQLMIDSAEIHKKTDIDKSINYIAFALESLDDQGNEKERALALSALGEIYYYHQQYDLAIASYRDAQSVYKTTKTALLLGEALIRIRSFTEAEAELNPLIQVSGMVPYLRVQLFENLGDVYSGLGDTPKAVSFYEEGLKIATKNRISPKIPDLNSKIADVYARDDKSQEAEAYYEYSLEQAASQAPQRAVREKEKVADFYNRENRYDDEINLRKKSLSELKSIPAGAADNTAGYGAIDSITTQQINYKIANAYLAQDKIDEALPFLVESIKEAEDEDDLEVKKDATRTLSEVYREKGDFTKALETYQQYVAVVDTLYLRKEEEIAQAARFNREIASRQNRINSLESDRLLSESKFELASTQQQLIEETNRRQKWVIYSLLLVILLTALAAFFFYRSNRQQKLANNLLALKSLRSQMNPHFIFNALNSVNNYIAKSDERSANKYLSDFSTLMRAVLENSEEDFIPLSDELELIGLYLKLEHSRFPEKFDYDLSIDSDIDLSAYQIPPMLLQPYVENAVWHGLRYKEE